MIINAILDIFNTITEEFKEMKSNIINTQEKENNSSYKLEFWGKVEMIMISKFLIILIITLFLMSIIALGTFVGLKTLLPILIVAITIYVMFKTEVFYKLLYKLFKKDDKENDK